MTPEKLRGNNVVRLEPPKDWDEAKFGPCETLDVHNTPIGLTSVWKPSQDELAALVTGGSIALTIVSNVHPPVILSVVKFDEKGNFQEVVTDG